MKDFIIFKNPKTAYREEEFGGIVKSPLQLGILGKDEFLFFKRLSKPAPYISLNKKEKEIINKFLKFGFCLKIDKKRAEELIKKASSKNTE